MVPYRLYITFLYCCLFSAAQACHSSRGPGGKAAATAEADTPVTGIAAAQQPAASVSVSAAAATPATGVNAVQPAATKSAAQSARIPINASPAAGITAPAGAAQSSSDPEEQAFRRFFAVFRKAVQLNNPAQLENLLYFPLQTARQWTNEDLQNMSVDKESGKVSRREFNNYRDNIFTADVVRLLPKAGEEELSEIDARSPEDYYKVLRKCTDRDTKMYEVYMQYPEKNGTAESYFAFVFGRVSGQYKVIGYYAKWPAKG